MANAFLLIGSLAGFLGVAAGAFGAHGLRSRLSPDMLAVFETAVRYQMYHVFALLITAVAIGRVGDARLLTIAGWSFITGMVLFSGSLYALALTGISRLGAITPLGGLALLVGWACLAIFAAAR
jgi:uncharacterized membrane protein YgdD (TMEM256/DUF423 family)